jgi:flavin reductase (DIM6/NTAB) family NADH-FMN oxidoreductase RutF
MISLSINEGRPGFDHIMSGGVFTINIVGDKNSGYLKHFWKGYPPGEGPFNEIPHEVSSNGGILMSEVRSTLECKMISKVRPGDHDILFAEVLASHHMNDDLNPKVHLRKNGLDY